VFFLGWIADLESYFLMQKYSQGAGKEASTQEAQNRSKHWTLARVKPAHGACHGLPMVGSNRAHFRD